MYFFDFTEALAHARDRPSLAEQLGDAYTEKYQIG